MRRNDYCIYCKALKIETSRITMHKNSHLFLAAMPGPEFLYSYFDLRQHRCNLFTGSVKVIVLTVLSILPIQNRKFAPPIGSAPRTALPIAFLPSSGLLYRFRKKTVTGVSTDSGSSGSCSIYR